VARLVAIMSFYYSSQTAGTHTTNPYAYAHAHPAPVSDDMQDSKPAIRSRPVSGTLTPSAAFGPQDAVPLDGAYPMQDDARPMLRSMAGHTINPFASNSNAFLDQVMTDQPSGYMPAAGKENTEPDLKRTTNKTTAQGYDNGYSSSEDSDQTAAAFHVASSQAHAVSPLVDQATAGAEYGDREYGPQQEMDDYDPFQDPALDYMNWDLSPHAPVQPQVQHVGAPNTDPTQYGLFLQQLMDAVGGAQNGMARQIGGTHGGHGLNLPPLLNNGMVQGNGNQNNNVRLPSLATVLAPQAQAGAYGAPGQAGTFGPSGQTAAAPTAPVPQMTVANQVSATGAAQVGGANIATAGTAAGPSAPAPPANARQVPPQASAAPAVQGAAQGTAQGAPQGAPQGAGQSTTQPAQGAGQVTAQNTAPGVAAPPAAALVHQPRIRLMYGMTDCAALPPCVIGARELQTFFNKHSMWPSVNVRLVRNDYKAKDLCIAELYGHGMLNPTNLDTALGAMRHRICTAADQFFGIRNFKPVEKKNTGDARMAARPDYDATNYFHLQGRTLVTKTLFELGQGIAVWPTGEDRGVVTQAVWHAVQHNDYTSTTNDIPNMVTRYGFTMPAEASLNDWDQRAKARLLEEVRRSGLLP
jgi:hypothetical protein